MSISYSVGDICDRLSILTLKRNRLPSEDYENEYLILCEEYLTLTGDYPYLQTMFELLLDVNSRIWDLESDIRKGKEGTMPLEEVGRRAVAIRDLNRKRVETKNEINKLTKTGFEERKSTW